MEKHYCYRNMKAEFEVFRYFNMYVVFAKLKSLAISIWDTLIPFCFPWNWYKSAIFILRLFLATLYHYLHIETWTRFKISSGFVIYSCTTLLHLEFDRPDTIWFKATKFICSSDRLTKISFRNVKNPGTNLGLMK